MQRNRRPRRETHKLCAKRLKTAKNALKTVPIQNFELSTSKDSESIGVALRRSKRLSTKNDDIFNVVLDKYENKKMVEILARDIVVCNRDVIGDVYLEIYRAAALVDLRSTGKCYETGLEISEQQQFDFQTEAQELPHQPVPPHEWKFSTPEQQKIKPQKPKQAQIVPAVLHTASKYKMLYELEQDHFDTHIQLNNVTTEQLFEFDASCVRDVRQFEVNEQQQHQNERAIMQFLPIEETVGEFYQQKNWQQYSTDAQIVPPSPKFQIHRQLISKKEEPEGPFPQLLHTYLDFHSDAAQCSSGFVSPTIDNFFVFSQSDVTPFVN